LGKGLGDGSKGKSSPLGDIRCVGNIWDLTDDQLRTNLISSAISDDGTYIAISDLYETKLFNLQSTPTGTRAIRIKSFLHTLSKSSHTSHLDIGTKGLGSSTLAFTPDSRRLVLGHVQSGNIIVVALPAVSKEEVEVVKCFQMGGNMIHGRVIAGLTKKQRKAAEHAEKNGLVKAAADGEKDKDVEMNGDDAEEDEGEEEKQLATTTKETGNESTWISCLAASNDGQWLVSSDTSGRVTIFNLDTLQVCPIF
jgi:U3 small nucleolar RNA-associated protein 4